MLNLTRPIRNNDQLFRLYLFTPDVVSLCALLKFKPKKILEIGIGTTDGVQSLEFILNGAKAKIFEPHPVFYKELATDLEHLPNLKIYNQGIYKEKGKKKFYDKWACTFIGEMYDHSGAKIQDSYVLDEKDAFECEVDTIDNYDDGDVDLLCMDCESCEWFVLEKLKSRPSVIQIETHSYYSTYHPFEFEKIKRWFQDNRYSIMATNESDCIYVKSDLLLALDKIEIKIEKQHRS